MKKKMYRIFYKNLCDLTMAKSCKAQEDWFFNIEEAFSYAKEHAHNERLRVAMVAELPK